MHELVAINANFHGTITEDGFITPSIEVVLVLTSPTYSFDASGACIKSRTVSDVRFAACPEQLISLAERCIQLAADCTRSVAEAVAKQPASK